jgi:hypothetical protein
MAGEGDADILAAAVAAELAAEPVLAAWPQPETTTSPTRSNRFTSIGTAGLGKPLRLLWGELVPKAMAGSIGQVWQLSWPVSDDP